MMSKVTVTHYQSAIQWLRTSDQLWEFSTVLLSYASDSKHKQTKSETF